MFFIFKFRITRVLFSGILTLNKKGQNHLYGFEFESLFKIRAAFNQKPFFQ